jgi:hypothetical protein
LQRFNRHLNVGLGAYDVILRRSVVVGVDMMLTPGRTILGIQFLPQ